MFLFKNFDGITKLCRGCGERKDVCDFSKEKRASSGLKSRCKDCLNKYFNERYATIPDVRIAKLKYSKAKPLKGKRKSRFTEEEQKSLRACRRLIHRLRIYKNGRKTPEILGYSHLDLIKHLGRMPRNGETLDHKIPITWFLDFNQMALINDLRNLQILSRKENFSKNNFYSHPVCEDYFKAIEGHIRPEYLAKIKCYGKSS